MPDTLVELFEICAITNVLLFPCSVFTSLAKYILLYCTIYFLSIFSTAYTE